MWFYKSLSSALFQMLSGLRQCSSLRSRIQMKTLALLFNKPAPSTQGWLVYMALVYWSLQQQYSNSFALTEKHHPSFAPTLKIRQVILVNGGENVFVVVKIV